MSRDSYFRTFTSLLLLIYPARVSETTIIEPTATRPAGTGVQVRIVGGCDLRNSIALSQSRGSATNADATVRPVRAGDGVRALGIAEAEGRHPHANSGLKPTTRWRAAGTKPTSKKAGALSPMMDGSNSRLQARSSCTTAAVLCLPAAMRHGNSLFLMPSASILAHVAACIHDAHRSAHARVMRSGCCCRPSVDEFSRRDAARCGV